jgi:LPXTG-motif cell wall-anchored protein
MAILAVAVLSTSLHPARAIAAGSPPVMPAPYVIAVDPGHGGSPTSDPNQQWDPGVVRGPEMEKDITLDIALRLRTLLEKEKVKVVMTRTTDTFLSIQDRWNIVKDSGARLFVSIHVNAFQGDSSVGGSMVLYPHPDSVPFANTLESALAAGLKPYGIKDDGVVEKSDLWVHSTIPTATIEPAYLTNDREAALLLRSDFRQAIAQSVLKGLLAFDPQIEATKKSILDAQALAARQAAARHLPATGGDSWNPWPAVLLALTGGMAAYLITRRRRNEWAPAYSTRRRPNRAHRVRRAHNRRRSDTRRR